MDITSFIKELLYSHDCVIIPEFGGFVGNYMPARPDKETATFYPPVKQITFNKNLNYNDGLLVKEISARLGVNYGDSRDMVNEYVSRIRKKFDKGEKVIFEGIGSFEVNHEGNIEFEPDRSINFHLDSYGLEPFMYQKGEVYDVRKKISGHHSEAKERNLRKYLWRAAVLVPVAGAMLAVSLRTDLFRTRVETTSLNPLVSAEFEENKTAIDNQATTVDETRDNLIQPVETAIASEAIPETAVETPEPTPVNQSAYYIITGSFKSEENAGKQASLLQAEGFNPEVILVENGFYRVCAMACPDLGTAKTKKESILSKFPNSWISRKK